MNISKILHQTASEYSTFAMVAKAKGQLEQSNQFFKQAFELERAAVLNLQMNEMEIDPLFPFIIKRSAAALAYKAGFYTMAEKLVIDALNENPPSFISVELKEIADLVNSSKKDQITQDSFQINGKLTSANQSKEEIEVEDINGGKKYTIFVPNNSIVEIAKSFFSEFVFIQGNIDIRGVMILEKITSAR